MAESVYRILVDLAGDAQVQQGLNKLAVAAGITGTALTAMSAAALDAANDVERSLGNLGTLLDDPATETQAFREEIRGLADDLKNTASVSKLTGEAYDVVSAGFSDASEAADVLRNSQRLALVGQGDLKNAADGVTTALNGLSSTFDQNATVQENSARVAGVFAETIRLGKTNIDQLGPAIARVAPQANNLDINVETLGASFAALTANGVKTKEAATQLQAIFRSLTAATPQAKAEMDRLGLSFDENTVRSDGLANTLKKIETATGGSAESLTKLLGSSEAVTGFLTLAKDDFGRLEEAIAATGNEAVLSGEKLETAFDSLSENRAVKAERALNQLSDTMVSLGQGVAIAVEPAIDAISFLLDNFEALPEPLKQAAGFITALTGVTLTLGAALVGLAIAVNQVNGAYVLMAPKVAATAIAMKAKAAAAISATAASVGLNVSLLPIVATLGLITAGVLAVNQAWSDYGKIQKANSEIDNRTATESLVNDLELLNGRLEKTGKAIPKKEFDIYIKAAKEAANETNGLGKMVATLEKKQANSVKKTEEATKANIANAETEEDRTDKISEYITETESAISAAETRFAAEASALEESLRSQGKSETEILAARSSANQQFYREQANLRRKQLDSSLVEGEERERIETDLLKINTAAQKDIRETRTKTTALVQAEAQKQAAAEKQAIADAKAARKAATDSAIADAKLVTDTNKAALGSQIAATQNASTLNSGNAQFLSSTSSILNDIAKTIQDENTSAKTRNKLLGISKGLMGDLRGLGFDITGTLTTEEGLRKVNAQLQQAEFQTKLQEIALKREEIALETQLQTLTESGRKLEAQLKLENKDITEGERKQLELQVQLADQRLGILKKQEAVSLRNLDLQERTVRAQSQVAAAVANESLEGSPIQSAADSNPSTTGADLDLTEVSTKIETANGIADRTFTEIQGLSQEITNLRSDIQNANSDISNIQTNMLALTDNSATTVNSLNGLLTELTRQSGILDAIRNDVTIASESNSRGLRDLSSAVSRLPGQIAASIPRQSNA